MRAAFFDLDGTLADTRADLAATVNHTRRDLGLRELPEDEVIAHVGQGARYLLEHAIPDASAPYETLWTLFRSHYAEHCCERLTLYPRLIETLETLRQRGWLLGVNTNKPNFAVWLILQKFNLVRYFGEAVVAGGDGFALKPSTEPLRVCAARLGHVLGPDDWMVGDAWTDMQCASDAGIHGAFCTYGFGRLNAAHYTVAIREPADLLTHLT